MKEATKGKASDRRSEWFVPKFGPSQFRVVMGLLFLPYTGMVLSFAIIGSVLADSVDGNRVLAIVVIYFLGLGLRRTLWMLWGAGMQNPGGALFRNGNCGSW